MPLTVHSQLYSGNYSTVIGSYPLLAQTAVSSDGESYTLLAQTAVSGDDGSYPLLAQTAQ